MHGHVTLCYRVVGGNLNSFLNLFISSQGSDAAGLPIGSVFGEGVCPVKAGMVSGRQSHRGKSQSPVAWVAFVEETKRMKPTDKAALGAVSESPGRNESPIKGDVKRHFSPPAGRPRIVSCIQPPALCVQGSP